jgi:hypothetical protein
MLIVLASLAGIFIGLNFRVVVLLPLILLGAGAYVVLSVEQGASATALAIVIAAASVQGGYMIGLTGRDLFAQILTRLNIAQSRRV